MENNVPQNIIDKIKKLLIMGEKATIHEKEVAIFKAQALMAKYHISEQDINLKDQMKVVEITVYDFNVKKELYALLANIVAKNFRCRTYFKCAGNKYYPVFMGMELDAEVAVEIFKNAYKIAKKETERIAHYYYNKIGHSRGVREEWLHGFVVGLRDGFKAQIELSSETAIMVVIPKEVDEAFSSKPFSSKGATLTSAARNGHAALNKAGYQNGYDLAYKRKQEALNNE